MNNAGIRLFLDRNQNGILDAGEPVQVADATGQVSFAQLPMGTYTVRLVPQQDFPVQFPDSSASSITIQVGPGAPVAANGFGFVPVNPAAILRSSQDLYQPNSTASSTVAFVEGLYHNILGRASDQAGLSFWSSQLDQGVPRYRIVQGIWASTEHRGLEVDYYYRHFLGRTERDAERLFWVGQFLAGQDENGVVLGFLSSPEYALDQGDSAGFVNSLYVKLLGRNADTPSLNSCLASLAAGASRLAVTTAILNSGEANLDGINSYYFAALHRQGDEAGRQGWLQQARAGMALSTIAQDFLASDEYFQNAHASVQGT